LSPRSRVSSTRPPTSFLGTGARHSSGLTRGSMPLPSGPPHLRYSLSCPLSPSTPEQSNQRC
jgi:hypothetical protein